MVINQGDCAEDSTLLEQSKSIAKSAKSVIHFKLNPSDMDSDKAHTLKVSGAINRLEVSFGKIKENAVLDA